MENTFKTAKQLEILLNPPEEEKTKEEDPSPSAHKPIDFSNREKPKYRKKPLHQIFKGYKKK